MERPDVRAMRSLPLLQPRRSALELCVFCPKLCRSACPVSNAEPRETITPWGKMTLAWMGAHGDVPLDASHAAPAWACTGCIACRTSCDHRNVVADVLLDARAAWTERGVAPAAARRAIAGFARHDRRTRAATARLARHPRVRAGARDALLVGCGYVRGLPREARDAVDATTGLTGQDVTLVEGCCGTPLLLAGDRAGFARHAAATARAIAGHERVFVVDAGCALALLRRYAEVDVAVAPEVVVLVEHAARELDRMTPVPCDEKVRYHDPCLLGRGLGVIEPPRAVLARILGRAPDELDEARERAVCSGAGGLLPSTMPEVARAIADARVAVHARSGGGRIVTACASSLRLLRSRTRASSVAVDDLASWIARAVVASSR